VTDAKVLIPADAPAAARTAVRRYHDGFDAKLRLRSLVAEATMAVPALAPRLLNARTVTVTATPGHLGSPVSPILDGIAEALSVDKLVVAFSLSTPKSNQKPVLQLLHPQGRCIGWAKIGWNERTDALIANEARWLQRPGSQPLIKPDLIHDVDIAGRRVVITTAVRPRRRSRRSRFEPPPGALFSAVAGLGSLGSLPVQETKWWQSVTEVMGAATDRERTAIEAAVERCGDQAIPVGAWHGDLTPWNLMTTGDGIQLIDWEFAADQAPFGFDLCHFHTQVGSELRGLDADRALDRSARLSPQGLVAIGVSPTDRRAVWELYLVELIRRQLALRVDGYPIENVTQGPAALRRLERALGPAVSGSVVAGSAAAQSAGVASFAELLASEQPRAAERAAR
jgi:hypothetical protein